MADHETVFGLDLGRTMRFVATTVRFVTVVRRYFSQPFPR